MDKKRFKSDDMQNRISSAFSGTIPVLELLPVIKSLQQNGRCFIPRRIFNLHWHGKYSCFILLRKSA